jgi:hypothetical protein
MLRPQLPPKALVVLLALLAQFACGSGGRAFGQCLNWSPKFGPPTNGNGANGTVHDLTIGKDFSTSQAPLLHLYAAGAFTQIGTVSANYVANWDGYVWAPLGTGTNDVVYALTTSYELSGIYQGVFAGGQFTLAGGQTVNHVARWDSYGNWVPLTDSNSSTGTDGPVFALKVFNGGAYIGGTFASAGSTLANNIARWDGTDFFALGLGTSGGWQPGRVDALEAFDDDGAGSNPTALFAGGYFTSAGGSGANLVAKWTGNTWQPLGLGIGGSNVDDLCVFDFDGSGPLPPELCAAGFFSTAGNNPAANVARWNGISWTGIGPGFDAEVRDLTVFDDGTGGGPRLYAIGDFTMSGSTPLNRIAWFDGVKWKPVGGGFTGGWESYCLAVYDDLTGGGDDLYAGGSFTGAGSNASSQIAEWHACSKADFGIVDGEVVVTMHPETALDFSVAVIDMGPPYPAPDTNWKAPKFHNEFAPSSSNEIWNRNNVGDVFGVTFDGANPPNIYVAATSSYAQPFFHPGGPGAVFKLDGVTADVSTFCVVPNTGWPALGDVCYDSDFNQFFVSSFEDGRIYRFGAAGNLLTSFDPFAVDNGASGPAPHGELVWAVQKYDRRELYFSAWLRDGAHMSTPWPAAWPPIGSNVPNNAIFKVMLDNSGNFTGAAILVKVFPLVANNVYSEPCSDIVFSPDHKRMLTSERTMSDVAIPNAHNSRVLEWVGGGPGNFSNNWTLSSIDYYTGNQILGERNCAGGGDYDCSLNVIATADAMHLNYDDDLYGIQRIPVGGNTLGAGQTSTSFLIDTDGETLMGDKTDVGDVEVWRTSCNQAWLTYCTAKLNSLGCLPWMDATGVPSLGGAGPFTLKGHAVRNNKSGLCFYSVNGPANAPFQNGILCVSTPIKRTVGVSSGGTAPPVNDCTGLLAIDMKAFAAGSLGGSPLPALSVAGTVVNAQFWSRDPGFAAPNNTSLTDGLEYTVLP